MAAASQAEQSGSGDGKLCLEAVRYRPSLVMELKSNLCTSEHYLIAVRHTPWLFQCVPDCCQTLEMSWIAVRYDIQLFARVADRFHTEALCWYAMTENRANLKKVGRWTSKLCLLALKLDPQCVAWLPTTSWNEAVCLEVLKSDLTRFTDLSNSQLTPAVVAFAINQDPKYLAKTEYLYKSQAICDAAVKKLPSMFPHVPRHMQTADMVRALVTSPLLTAQLYKEIKDHFKTDDVAWLAVQQDGMILKLCTKHQRTQDKIITAAVTKTPQAIRYAPCVYRTESHGNIIARSDGDLLRWIPAQAQTPDMCLRAVVITPQAVAHVSSSIFKDTRFCEQLMQWPPALLSLSPYQAMTMRAYLLSDMNILIPVLYPIVVQYSM